MFYVYIVKFDVKTPGRGDEEEIKMVTKADYKAAKGGETGVTNNASKAVAPENASPEVKEAIEAGVPADRAERFVELLDKLGGLENLTAIAACITRLRITVADPEKVDYDGIVAMGAKGCVGKGKAAQQHIFGAEADQFKGELLKLQDFRKKA